MTEDECREAARRRDARFDGWFVVGGRATGVYCRPSCPAALAVRVFPTPAAAQVSGLRACARCLPDDAPGSPRWNLRPDPAARAMRLLDDGVADLDTLAARLRISARHLSDVLVAELGADLAALTRARQARTARQLLAAALSPADAAFAVGFAGPRQLEECLRAVYGEVPRATGDTVAGGPLRVALRLPLRPPVDGAGLTAFLANRAIPGIEQAEHGRYGRTLALPHGPATVWLQVGETAVDTVLRLADPRDLATAVARVRRLLDADAAPAEVDAVLADDPALAPLVRRTPGIRVPGAVDGPELVLRAVFGQQISVAAARTLAGRLAAALGERLPEPDGPLHRLFPTPAAIAERGAEVLTGPRRRIATVLALASAMAEGRLAVHAGRDPRELSRELQALPGVGPWTAGYVAMRVLGDPDVLLGTDLMVRRGAEAIGLPADLSAHARRRWSPWRSYAGMHLWRASAPARLPRAPAV